jgi:type II secretory pathway pseudopilin PulG
LNVLGILPKLIKLVDKNNHNKNNDQRGEVCKLLLDAYRAFNGCVITQETIQMYIVPGLRLLQANSMMDNSFKSTVTRMLAEMEKVVGAPATPAAGEKKRWPF